MSFLLSILCLLVFATNALAIPVIYDFTAADDPRGITGIVGTITSDSEITQNKMNFGTPYLTTLEVFGTLNGDLKRGFFYMPFLNVSNNFKMWAGAEGYLIFEGQNNFDKLSLLSNLDLSHWDTIRLGAFTQEDKHGVLSDSLSIVTHLTTLRMREVNPVPEPSTLLLLCGGIAGLAFWRKRK
jgi:hypothetical protein